MSRRRTEPKRVKASLNKQWTVVCIVIAIIAFFITAAEHMELPFSVPTWNELYQSFGVADIPAATDDADVSVHIIDVGQGDSILICSLGNTVLIDAGENDQGDEVVNYLTQNGITELDYVIGTHPHSDHIGGLDYVIKNISVTNVILPKIPESIVPTTATYVDLLEAISDKDLTVTAAQAGTKIMLGEAALEILDPVGEFDDLNNMSVVCRLTYKDISFLFTGDAESEAETAIFDSSANIKATVLKVGHHGSTTSTSAEWLQAISPVYAAISVGAGNSYGHPHEDTLTKLTDYGCTINRTDFDGTIIYLTDGTGITVVTEK